MRGRGQALPRDRQERFIATAGSTTAYCSGVMRYLRRFRSRAIVRVENPRLRSAAMAYRSSWVIWAYIGFPLLGGREEPRVSQTVPLLEYGGVALGF